MYPEYNEGDSFLYYGDSTDQHGNLGIVERLEEWSGVGAYVCKVKGIVWQLTLSADKMKPVSPDWVM
jgi:hypothetical protein